jgi:selenocysteine lyase/cysteine desulfurase
MGSLKSLLQQPMDDWLLNEEFRNQVFPVTGKSVFLAHAGVCPLPAPVAQASVEYLNQCTFEDQEEAVPHRLFSDTRRLAAQLLGVGSDEIALVGPTSMGLSFVAAGLSWKPGDEVLVYFQDYPSNVYPWMALESQGVVVRYLRTQTLGEIELSDIQNQVTSRTRLVALASCHFLSGWRIDVETIGDWLREQGVLFCLDAIQTLGAFPVNARYVDFLAADAHKWLLGPAGAGILYVRKDCQAQLRPVVFGWNNVRCPDFLTQQCLDLKPDARRYEAGTAFLAGIVGLRSALDLLLSVGIDSIASRLRQHRIRLVQGLLNQNYTVLNPTPPENHCGGMVSFHRKGSDMKALHQTLRSQNIVASLRTVPNKLECLRFSPHFYNTQQELHFALQVLADQPHSC